MSLFPAATPIDHPLMYQEWRQLTFLHWSFDPAVIRPLIPKPFELDLFDNRAWIGIVPFIIESSRFPGVPFSLGFPETNVRTYVRAPNGETGVWFFSLDAASPLAVVGARVSFGLPYYLATTRVDVARGCVRYESMRGEHALDCRVEIGNPIDDGSALTEFLVNRHRLYTRILGRLAYGEVDHTPYPLSQVRLLDLTQSLFQTGGAPEAIHYSPGVDVRIGRPHFV